MDNLNLLIFTIYIIIVTYVFYQAYKSLGNKVTIQLDSAPLNEQLEELDLKDLLEIKFKFRPSYKLTELTKIPISIKNKSDDDSIRVNWDESSIADFEKVAGRVIRITPGITDIPQKQAVSIIVPGQTIEEELSDDKSLVEPLFKANKLKKATEKPDFFFLRLSLKISNLLTGERSCTLRFQFFPKKLRLLKALAIALKPR